MNSKDSPQKVIEAHRKRQQMRQSTPMAIMIGAAILLIAGAAALIFWFTGDNSPFKADPTPTLTASPTLTATATPLPPTSTPTITATSAPTETPSPTITETPSGPFEYTVQQNDTLSGIATRFGTNIPTLLALNPSIVPPAYNIFVGQKILVPPPNMQLPTATSVSTNVPPGTIISYMVMPGDSVGSIAVKFNSTVDAIVKENKLANANDINAGDILKVPVNIATPVPTATVGTVYPTANVPTYTQVPPTSTP